MQKNIFPSYSLSPPFNSNVLSGYSDFLH